MFRTFMKLFRGEDVVAGQPSGQECFNCLYWSYCDPEDIDEVDGYCGVNFKHDPHASYGTWTCHDDWCRWWEKADSAEINERRSDRALALRQAADAVARASD